MKYLVQYGKASLNIQDTNGYTELHHTIVDCLNIICEVEKELPLCDTHYRIQLDGEALVSQSEVLFEKMFHFFPGESKDDFNW